MGEKPGHPFRGNQWTATKKDLVAYHGTSGDSVESILEHGLRPYEETEPVFVSLDKKEAGKYASWRNPRSHAVIEVRIPAGTMHRVEKLSEKQGHILLQKPVPPEQVRLVPKEFE